MQSRSRTVAFDYGDALVLYFIDETLDRDYSYSKRIFHSAASVTKYQTVLDIRRSSSLLVQRFYF